MPAGGSSTWQRASTGCVTALLSAMFDERAFGGILSYSARRMRNMAEKQDPHYGEDSGQDPHYGEDGDPGAAEESRETHETARDVAEDADDDGAAKTPGG
jgi:hypothetical protein